jgi:membrane-bound serine protease (ClpP class)
MRTFMSKLLFVFLSISAAGSLYAESGEPNNLQEQKKVKAAFIICEGTIDDGLYKSIERRSELALELGCEYLIFEIDTFGGELMAAHDIWEYFMHDINLRAHTVAYVSKKAISAGALISVACNDIIMKQNTRIGDCAPIALGAKLEGVEREKVETDTRAAFEAAGEENGYPTVLLKAMVTQQIEVYKVKNKETGKLEFFEGDSLPDDPNKYDIDNKKVVVTEDELLTLTASEAFEYGLARAVVKNRSEVLSFLAERDGVSFDEQVLVLKTSWSEEMVRWLNSPVVAGILIMVALLGVYIEFNTPGIGLPGLVAAICFAIIIGSKYLIGMANWIEVALFVVGLVLLTIEVFVLPGFGIAGVTGIICIMAGIFGMLVKNPPDTVPWPQSELDWYLFTNGLLGLLTGIAGFLILAYVFSKFIPRLEFLSGLMLAPTPAKKGDEVEISSTCPPEAVAAGLKVGDTGTVITTLRPAGAARFGDAVVDVVAEGDFLAAGTKVKIIEIRGNRVVVRAVEN